MTLRAGVGPVTGGKSYVGETGKSTKDAESAVTGEGRQR
jgi:hypothetical protein